MAIDSRNSTDSSLRSPEVCQKVPGLNGRDDARAVEIVAALPMVARADGAQRDSCKSREGCETTPHNAVR
jgi:hypothetical protein